MKLIKMLGAALLSCAALLSVGANAQQVPVSCSWSVTSSYGPPNQSWRVITRECKESNGTLVATQTFRAFPGSSVMENCVLTPSTGFSYNSTCESPSFFKLPPPPTCASAGLYLGAMCVSRIDAIPVASACGNHCSLHVQVVGGGNCGRENPLANVYCK